LIEELDALREEGRYVEAAEILHQALDAGLPPVTLQAELGRLYLLAGNLLNAAEACMAEEELRTSAERRLANALSSYVSEGLTFAGGWGVSPDAAVAIGGATTESRRVNAIHRYLEFVLGERGSAWHARRAFILFMNGSLYDGMDALLPGERSITVFFARPASLRVRDVPSGAVLGSVTLDADLDLGGAGVTLSPEFDDPPLAGLVLEGLMQHTAQSLLLRRAPHRSPEE
jgi:hypothetical protein